MLKCNIHISFIIFYFSHNYIALWENDNDMVEKKLKI